jgi:hypothetical protein
MLSRKHLSAKTAALVGILLFVRPAYPSELPPAKQALFLARVIAYDANLKARAGPAVNIAILSKKGDKDSEKMAEALFRAFTTLESAKLLGLPVRISQVSYVGKDVLERALLAEGIDTLYVCSGLEGSHTEIKAVLRAMKVLSIGSDPAHLRMGFSLGVFEIDGRNTILVNLEANREEGVSFGPDLLRLATVVK